MLLHRAPFFTVFALSIACATLAAVTACSDLKVADSADGGDGTSSSSGDAQNPGAPTKSDGSSSGSTDAQGGGGGSDGPIPPAGAVCTDTTCTVTTVLNNLYGPVSIAVDNTHLYLIEVGKRPNRDFGQLVRINKATCTTASCFDLIDDSVLDGQLAGEYIYEAHVALGPNDVCYTQSYNADAEHSIKCFSLTAATFQARELDDGTGAVTDLWLSGTDARWIVTSNVYGPGLGGPSGRPLTGGATTAFVTNRVNPISVTSDGPTAYWSESGDASPQGSINANLPDGGVRPIASVQDDPIAVRIFNGYLYWIESSKKTVMRARVDGSGAAEQIATTDDNPVDLAVDASGVYWISSGQGSGVSGSLSHAPLTPNGAITTMIQNINLVYSFALDATDVYVASVGQTIADGLIVKIPKTK